MNSQVKDPTSGLGYGWHEYINAVQHLLDDGTIVQDVIDVPAKTKSIITKKGKQKTKVLRPAHKFAFLCLPENAEQNGEWNAKAINKWIADVEAALVK